MPPVQAPSLLERSRRWYDSRRVPSLDWIQVEVTSHCNAACVYCPRTAYRENWLTRHLALETYGKLLPAFGKAGLVFLQGWGEPLLHRDFFTMVGLAKKAGCRVGTTTNGTLLDEGMIREMVDSGIDIVGFSLAGTGGRNDAFRRGTSFENVLEAIRRLKEVKEEKGSVVPAVHIAYMLLRSAIEDVMDLPRVLNGLGISQVVISTLDFVPARELEDEAFTSVNGAERKKLRLLLESVEATAYSYGVPIHYRLASAISRPKECTENLQRALFVSADGEVSPCVFTNLPVSSASFIAQGEERPYRRLTFGKINEQPLAAIWRQDAYTHFRNCFSAGHLSPLCQGCPKLFGT